MAPAPSPGSKEVYDRTKRPERPRPGLVVRVDYLWKDQEAAWRKRNPNAPNPGGRKERAVVLTDVYEHPSFPGQFVVDVAAITHSPPESGRDDKLVVPDDVKRDLGINDGQTSYLAMGEVNRFVWPHGVLPFRKPTITSRRDADGQMPRTEWHGGFLRKGFYREMVEMRDALREGRSIGVVARSYGT